MNSEKINNKIIINYGLFGLFGIFLILTIVFIVLMVLWDNGDITLFVSYHDYNVQRDKKIEENKNLAIGMGVASALMLVLAIGHLSYAKQYNNIPYKILFNIGYENDDE